MLYKEMENMSIDELIEVKSKLIRCLELKSSVGLKIGLKILYGEYSETSVNTPEAIKTATDLIREYIERISNIIVNKTLKRYYIIVDQTLTIPGEYGITINTYIVLANSEEDAKRICKEKYILPDREFNIEACELVDDLQEGLISSAEWYE